MFASHSPPVPTARGIHRALHAVGTMDSFPAGAVPEECRQLPPLSRVEVKSAWDYTPLTQTHSAERQFLSHVNMLSRLRPKRE